MAEKKSDRAPLKLYWWNDEPNFGDALSPLLVEYASGRPVEWALNSKCDIFSLGSIMKQARRGFHKNAGQEYKPFIWGTGMIGPQRLDFLNNVHLQRFEDQQQLRYWGSTVMFSAIPDCWFQSWSRKEPASWMM